MTTFDPQLRQDILPTSLTSNQEKIKVEVGSLYATITRDVVNTTQQTPGQVKNIIQVMDLIKVAIEDYENRSDLIEDAKVIVTYEMPDEELDKLLIERKAKAIISIALTRREPGSYSQGAPFEGRVKNLRPILRQEVEDTENPGYRRAILGYFFDNVITLTVWARTNKTANSVALWLESLMDEYTWFFRYSGTNRILYWGRPSEKIIDVDNNRYYGRPIDYFVRTERLTSLSQKELESLVIRMQLSAY